MASDSKKTKAETAPKEAASKAAPKDAAPKDVAPKDSASKDAAPKDAAPKDAAPKNDAAAKVEGTAAEAAPKSEGGDTAAKAPSNYSRGEGQKPVTAAYKENWNAIFAKNKTKKKKR